MVGGISTTAVRRSAMGALKPAFVSAITLAAVLPTLTPQAADAGVWFFSRSGQDSHFAAGVHGYDKPDANHSRVRTGSISQVRYIGYDGDRPVWRERAQLDYYPTTVTRHGDHLDVAPGRYRYESTGYWDWRPARPR